ncbi:MAG: hypothetical protein IPP74_12465 [Alphaproteobacteria bacterium]|nr:hypothetical protein [Alphaproteobacteria bacterium]
MSSLEQFSKSINVLFSMLGMEATYIPTNGSAIEVKVIPKRPDTILGLGETSIYSETVLFDLRTEEIAEPQADDILEYRGVQYRILSEPKRDLHRLVWTVEATESG